MSDIAKVQLTFGIRANDDAPEGAVPDYDPAEIVAIGLVRLHGFSFANTARFLNEILAHPPKRSRAGQWTAASVADVARRRYLGEGTCSIYEFLDVEPAGLEPIQPEPGA